MTDKKKAVSIMVPSKDPKEKKDGDGGDGGGDKEGGKDILEPEELSEEDKALKEGLELAVTRVDD
ncbi:unnamed protein product, partial [Hapterophycus canaliculatus]